MTASSYVRRSAEIEGDFVVLVIGAHVNRWRDVRAWFPVFRAMPRMVRELEAKPELGLLKAYGGWMFGGPTYIQYWRSYEQLIAYARSAEAEHLPAWRAFNRATRAHGDAVGVFHETYRIRQASGRRSTARCPRSGCSGPAVATSWAAGAPRRRAWGRGPRTPTSRRWRPRAPDRIG